MNSIRISNKNRMIKVVTMILLLSLYSFTCTESNKGGNKNRMINEKLILEELEFAFKGTPGRYFPKANPRDIIYNSFLDLEYGYCLTAGSRIHLYADSTSWAIVFEKNGYFNRATRAEIELIYVGNCIQHEISNYNGQIYISNSINKILIESSEFDRIEYKMQDDLEFFEKINPNVKEIKIRDKFVPFDSNHLNYEKVGIEFDVSINPKKWIGFGDLIRYLHETDPSVISANESDIRQLIPKDIPKLMTIDEFCVSSNYDENVSPSQLETYQLISKILVTKDTSLWKPTQKPNNSWKNWDSGHL